MQLNKYFFEALRKRLENILRALSNNRKAHIVYSSSIATDVKNTVYLQARDYIEPDVQPALAELLLFYKACVSHEGAHIRFTSLNDWKEACNRGPVFQNITNIIEDGRIETAISQVLPGTGRWIKFTNQYVYNNRKPETYGTGLQAFLMGLNIYSILQIVPPFLSPDTQKLIKLAAPYVDIGRAATTTKEVLGCVEEILTIPEIKSLVDASSPPPMIEGDKGTTSPENTKPSKETSERAEKAQQIIKRRKSRKTSETPSEKEEVTANKKTSKNNKNEDTEGTSESSSEATEKNVSEGTHSENQGSGKENSDDDLDKEGEKDNKLNSNDDIEDTPEELDSNNSSDDNSDDDSGNLSDDDSEDNDLSSDDSEENLKDDSDGNFDSEDNDLSSDDSEENLKDDSDGNFDSEDNDLSSDDSEDNDLSSDDSEDNDLSSNDSEDDDLSSDDSEDDDLSNDDSEDETDGSDSSSHKNLENNGSDTNHGNPSYNEDEEEFFNNPPLEEDFEELLENTDEEVLSLTKEAEGFEEEDAPQDILEGIPADIHGGVELCEHNLKAKPGLYQKLKEQNEVLIKNLVNEIQVSLETRKAYDLRNLNRGRLHSGSLWKIAVPNPTVFSQRTIPGDIPELAVYILVDLSGSMGERNTNNGPTRIQSVKNATCVLSEAMRELKITHAVTGFKAAYPQAFHYPAVTWDDIKSTKIASFRNSCSNRDGYSIRVAANELSYRQEPKKILFVLSDGQPADYGGYVNDLAWNDVKQTVFEARQKGIKIISLFFGDEYLIPTFRHMYDTPVFVPDLTVLPRTLGEVFKRVYLE